MFKLLFSNSTWEPSPSYSLFLSESSNFIRYNFNQLMTNYSFPQDTINDLDKCLSNLHRHDYILMFILAIFWTIVRNLLTSLVFQVILISLSLFQLKEMKPFFWILWLTVNFVYFFVNIEANRSLLQITKARRW